jgi:hypothetical protein
MASIKCDNILTGIVSTLAILYVAFQLRNKRWSAVVAFVVIGALMCCGTKFNIVPCSNVCVCLLLAIVGSNVVALPTTASSHASHETFANHDGSHKNDDEDDTKQGTGTARGDEAGDNEEDSVGADETDSAAGEDADKNSKHSKHSKHGTTSPSKEKRTGGKSKSKSKGKGKNDDDDDDDDDDHVDSFSTFMETYRSLSPDQVESMTTDTKDLISTQKALMETVQNLAPVISQGKEMMDTFKDYFGPSGTNDLMQAFKSKKTV